LAEKSRTAIKREHESMKEYLYGRQPVLEALRAGNRLMHQLMVLQTAKSSPELDEIISIANQKSISIEKTDKRRLEQASDGGNHQGVVLQTAGYAYADLQIILRNTEGNVPFILILDHIQDPQNLGSIIRTAESAGVHGVIIPKDRAAGVTPAVVRASAGAVEHMAVAKVANLVQTMKNLRDDGFWFTGLEAVDEAKPYTESDLTGPVGLVIGSEGRGLQRLVRETCDFLIKLPLSGKISSLNANAAAAIALYEVVRQRNQV
jgi:23S rRNA (guanosine2251-2'-O)-methyltransferase